MFWPAITVCNDHIFRELLFNNETKTELKNTFNAYYWKLMEMSQFIQKFNYSIDSPDRFIYNLTLYYINFYSLFNEYKIFKFYINYFQPTFNTLNNLLNIKNIEEFDQNMNSLNNKRLNGLYFTKNEFEMYDQINSCKLRNNQDKLLSPLCRDVLSKGLKILSPFGKCITHLSKSGKNQNYYFSDETFELTNNLVQLGDRSQGDYYEYKLTPITRKIIIHSFFRFFSGIN